MHYGCSHSCVRCSARFPRDWVTSAFPSLLFTKP